MGRYNFILRNHLYDVAGRPWEGDNTLQSRLIKIIAQWFEIDSPEKDPPVRYSPAEVEECLDRDTRQTRVHEEMQHVRDFIRVNIDGLVLNEEYEGVRERAKLIKMELAEETETEEQGKEFDQIWPFQDHEELD